MTLEELNLRYLIEIGYDVNASDVYVKADQVPMMSMPESANGPTSAMVPVFFNGKV